MSINRDAIFLSATMEISIPNVSYVPLKKVGEFLRPAPIDRAGIFFIEHSDTSTMQDLTRNLYKFAKLEILDIASKGVCRLKTLSKSVTMVLKKY